MPFCLARLRWAGAAMLFVLLAPAVAAQDMTPAATQALSADLAREFERAWLQAQKRVAPLNKALVWKALRTRQPLRTNSRRPANIRKLGR